MISNAITANVVITFARNSPSNGDMEIVVEHSSLGRRKTRSIFLGMSSTNERALQGEEVTVATLSEAAEHPKHIFDKYLATRCWKVNCPTTPNSNQQDLNGDGIGDLCQPDDSDADGWPDLEDTILPNKIHG